MKSPPAGGSGVGSGAGAGSVGVSSTITVSLPLRPPLMRKAFQKALIGCEIALPLELSVLPFDSPYAAQFSRFTWFAISEARAA